jgi:hypothetical protein
MIIQFSSQNIPISFSTLVFLIFVLFSHRVDLVGLDGQLTCHRPLHIHLVSVLYHIRRIYFDGGWAVLLV